MPDPVEQDFTADGSEYLAVLLAMSEATDKWAQTVLADVAKVQAALDSLHGETVGISTDTEGISAGVQAATAGVRELTVVWTEEAAAQDAARAGAEAFGRDVAAATADLESFLQDRLHASMQNLEQDLYITDNSAGAAAIGLAQVAAALKQVYDNEDPATQAMDALRATLQAADTATDQNVAAWERLREVYAEALGSIDSTTQAMDALRTTLQAADTAVGDGGISWADYYNGVRYAAAATKEQGNSAIFATQAMSMFAIGLGVTHLLVTSLGANVVADAIGFTAFGIAATEAIGPVVSGLSTLTTSYGNLDNYQRAAALSLNNFLNSMGSSEPQVFTVLTQGLNLVESQMSAAGGVTSQASIAFMDFFAMLKQQFASSGWVSLFGRSTGAIRTDMDALFSVLNQAVGLIPGIFHDFNGLGLGVLGFASGLLHATAAVLEFDPALTKVVAGVSLAATAWHLLGNSISWIPAMGPTLSGLGADFTKTYQGARIAGQGIAEAGLTALGAVPAFALIAAEGIAFVAIANAMPDPIRQTISALAQQDQALGDNAAGYSALSASLNEYLTHEKQLPSDVAPRSLIQVAQAQQLAASTANTLNTNFKYLDQTYGITNAQAYQLAQATGVNLKQALTGSSTAAQEARTKIAAYEQTVNAARAVETQFAFDMKEATNSTLAWTTRLQGLSTAFSVLSGPLLGAMNAAASFKQAQVALNQAEDQGTSIVGTATAKQAALTQALAAADAAAIKDSEAIFNQAKQTSGAATAAQQAIAPLVAMKNQILDLGLKGQAAAQLVAQLNQEINALHSKTITITTYYKSVGQAGGGGHTGTGPGGPPYAGGTDSATPGAHLVGEQGPEMVFFGGGERVYSAAQTAALLRGGGGMTVNVGGVTVNGGGGFGGLGPAGKQGLQAAIQAAVLDYFTRNGRSGLVPNGRRP